MGKAMLFDIIGHLSCPKELIKIPTNANDATLA